MKVRAVFSFASNSGTSNKSPSSLFIEVILSASVASYNEGKPCTRVQPWPSSNPYVRIFLLLEKTALGQTISMPRLYFRLWLLASLFHFYQASGATFVVTNSANFGTGTLRDAINWANTNAGPDEIQFNIGAGGPQVIGITTSLLPITESVTIDGTTQPGYSGTPLIEISGAVTPWPFTGLNFAANSNIVRSVIVNRFTNDLIRFDNSSYNTVENCWLGVDAAGTNDYGGRRGIYINVGSNNSIGSSAAAGRNIIAGCSDEGIYIFRGTNNVIQGNYIGTDVTGSVAIGNSTGVRIQEGCSNVVGGTVSGQGNVVSGNFTGVGLESTWGNTLQGNIVGLNAVGTAKVYFGLTQTRGISIYQSNTNLIGGTVAGARNVISGLNHGVELQNASANRVEGNYIGTDVSGTNAVGNSRGIYGTTGATRNFIGGTVAEAGNLISANVDGIYFNQASSNLVQRNVIGHSLSGTNYLGNSSGITIVNSLGNMIGGTNGLGNLMVSNFYGVRIETDNNGICEGNLVRFNSIYGGSTAGFSIRFPEPGCFGCLPFNDSTDFDSGPNRRQNYPVLSSAVTGSGLITIDGTLNSTGNSMFTIDFYASPGYVKRGFGEGKTYIGSTVVFTDPSGNANLNTTFVDDNYSGQFISAIAVDSDNNSSEFSEIVVADNPAGVIEFSDANWSSAESGSVYISVRRFGGTNAPASIAFSTADGTAVAGLDYTAVSGVVTFTNGQDASGFFIPVTADTINEPNETVALTLSNPSNGALTSSLTNATLTIFDNDLTSMRVSDAPVTKLSSGTNYAVFNVTLSVPSASTATVSYATADLTAQQGIHYISTSGQLEFPPLTTNQTISVPIIGSTTTGTKAFALNLSGATVASIADGQGIGTIYDGSQGIIGFSTNNFTVAEGGGTATMWLLRTGGTVGNVSIPYVVSNITANAGSDYTLVTGVVSFINGQASNSFSLSILNDQLNEATETVGLALGQPTGTSPGTLTNAVLTITDDDPMPTVAISNNLSAAEGNSGAQNFNFNVRLSAPSGQLVTVSFATSNHTATASSDYIATNGVIAFTPGQTNQLIQVVVNGDTAPENNEQFFFVLGQPTNAIPGAQLRTGTILNDDTIPQVSVTGDFEVIEGPAGQTNYSIFTVQLNRTYSYPISVSFSADGDEYSNATPGSDYISTNGTLTFAAGERTKTVSIPIIGDDIFEGSENYYFLIGDSPANEFSFNLQPFDAQEYQTILDDDLPPLSIFRNNAQIRVTWHPQAYMFYLQSSTNLIGTNWITVTNVPEYDADANVYFITNNASGSQEFYRLRRYD